MVDGTKENKTDERKKLNDMWQVEERGKVFPKK